VWTPISSKGGYQRVHVDHRDSPVDHPVDGIGQRADAEGLDGDEIPVLGRHVVDGGTLPGRAQLAVEPGDLDIEEPAPKLGRRCLPWAHQVAWRPAFEKAARKGCSERPISWAMARATSGSKPNPPRSAPAAAPDSPAFCRNDRRESGGNTRDLLTIIVSLIDLGADLPPGAAEFPATAAGMQEV
jgi:hypothetical protein